MLIGRFHTMVLYIMWCVNTIYFTTCISLFIFLSVKASCNAMTRTSAVVTHIRLISMIPPSTSKSTLAKIVVIVANISIIMAITPTIIWSSIVGLESFLLFRGFKKFTSFSCIYDHRTFFCTSRCNDMSHMIF